MEIKAQAKNVRLSPRKVRAIAAVVKKMPIQIAQEKLEFWPKNGARLISNVLKSAIANAAQNPAVKADKLKIKNIFVDEGLKMKRRDFSHGARFGGGLIQKRNSHITVILEG